MGKQIKNFQRFYRPEIKGTGKPGEEQMQSIKTVSERLGVAVPEPKTRFEAAAILDDLYRQEKQAKRKMTINEQLAYYGYDV